MPLSVGNPPVLNNPTLLCSLQELNPNNVKRFFFTLDSIAGMSQWSEQHKLTIAIIKLDGACRTFYENTLAHIENLTYGDFSKRMVSHFSIPISYESLLAEFAECSQKQGESVRDFASRLEGLAYRTLSGQIEGEQAIHAVMQKKLIRGQFLSGLIGEIKAQLVILDPPDFETAVKMAERVELSLKCSRQAPTLIPVNTTQTTTSEFSFILELIEKSNRSQSENMDKLSAQVLSLQQKLQDMSVRGGDGGAHMGGRQRQNRSEYRPNNQSGNSYGNFTCHYCGIRGHFLRDCRKRQREMQGDQSTGARSRTYNPTNNRAGNPN